MPGTLAENYLTPRHKASPRDTLGLLFHLGGHRALLLSLSMTVGLGKSVTLPCLLSVLCPAVSLGPTGKAIVLLGFMREPLPVKDTRGAHCGCSGGLSGLVPCPGEWWRKRTHAGASGEGWGREELCEVSRYEWLSSW